MPKLGRVTPCSECPWLKKSRRGWLGESDPVEFYRTSITNEQEMPCHNQIDYEDPLWLEDQLPNVDLCAGGLIYFRNHHKSPRGSVMRKATEAVEPSPHVFSQPGEFISHHSPGREMPEVMADIGKALWPYPDKDEDEDES